MPVSVESADFPLPVGAVRALWQATLTWRLANDAVVAVRSVSEADIQSLNKQYRGVNAPTNVLTFSYPPDGRLGQESASHDVALCVTVAEKEARHHAVELSAYVALLVTHAFLHVLGMDHEQSEKQDEATREAEQAILVQCGWPPLNLADL